MLKDLEGFQPEERGFVSSSEIRIISETLCISEMDGLGLHNLRDMAVMYYSRKQPSETDSQSREEFYRNTDKMSAVVAVIDRELIKRGYEV